MCFRIKSILTGGSGKFVAIILTRSGGGGSEVLKYM